MSAFEQLHPSVQHHIVNSLGWRQLRPLQEQAISPLLDGQHALLLAPTAGGKTEAAMFPVFSRMLSEDWSGLSVVYLCPIKALLNDLSKRLQTYADLFGRRVAVWHGDIGQSERKRIIREPPDILLSTPESLEVLLDSRLVEHRRFFRNLRAVVVDEIHAFAGDDRGWHLSALLSRIHCLAASPVQRIGLSATVGNREELLAWLADATPGKRTVVAPEAVGRQVPDIALDYVGSLENAALVIARLHKGEKRLVFCDSRAQVEELVGLLRVQGVETFASHSALSKEQRLAAEQAFAESGNCVIVATSTLELGIDIGDLDRMIQINAPGSVASLLQRLGRTGRRDGGRSNCLMLATSSAGFHQAAGLLKLWKQGYVEPVLPPPLPFHVLVQQILGLVLQERALEHDQFRTHLHGFLQTARLEEALDPVLEHLLAEGILYTEGGLISMGDEGERHYGRKNFMDLFSIFNTPPYLTAMHGRNELGQIDEGTLLMREPTEVSFSLGGRSWQVTEVDWNKRRVWVMPTKQEARSSWMSFGKPLTWDLAQGMREALVEPDLEQHLTERGHRMLNTLHEDYAWLDSEGSCLVQHDRECYYWSFAGTECNLALEMAMKARTISCKSDGLRLRFKRRDVAELKQPLQEVLSAPEVASVDVVPTDADYERYKFLESVPKEMVSRMLGQRREQLTQKRVTKLEPIKVISERAHSQVDPQSHTDDA